MAKCLSCGFSGDLREIVGALYSYGDIDAETMTEALSPLDGLDGEASDLSLDTGRSGADPEFSEEWLDSFAIVSSRISPWAVKYLNDRRVTRPQINLHEIRADVNRGRVVVPLRDAGGVLRGAIGRATVPDVQPRYWYYKKSASEGAARGFTWFGENLVNPGQTVVAVEGVFDALSVSRVYSNVVAVLGTGMRHPASPWARAVTRWVTMFDSGRSGDQARARFSRIVPASSRVHHLAPPPGRDDPGEATERELLEVFTHLTKDRVSL